MILLRVVLCKHSKLTSMNLLRCTIKWPQRFVVRSPKEKRPRANDCLRRSTSRRLLGVNKNTVIRALHILREEGLLDFTRGRGVRVVGTPQRGAVLTRIDELLTFARTQGIDKMRLSHSFKLELDIVESGAMKSGSLQYGGEELLCRF